MISRQAFAVLILSCYFQQTQASVSQWVNAFVENSQVIESSFQAYSSAEEGRKESKTNFLPKVSIEGAYIEQEVPAALTGGFNVSPEQIYDAGLVVEQPIYLGGKIWAGVRQRNAASIKAKSEYRQKKNQAIYEFLDLLFEKRKAEEVAQVLQGSQLKYQDFVRATEKRSRMGNVRSFELAQAKSNALSYVPKIRALQVQVEIITAKIASLVPPKQQPKTAGSVFLTSEQIQQMKQQPVPQLSEHPNWVIAEQSEEYARASKSLALGEHYPSLFVRGKWGYRSIEKEDLGRSNSRASEIRLGVSIPLFSGLSSVYVRRSQQALIKSAELLKEYSKKSLVAERDSTEKNMNAQIQQLADVDTWRKSARKALEQGVRSYQLGVIDNFQVVSLQQGLEAAETNYIESIYKLNRVFLSWCVAHGFDLDTIYRD